MVLISVVAVVAIVFGVGSRFYWGWKRGATHDTWYHLYISDRIRRERRLPDRVEQFLVPGPYDYPPVLHLLLAAVPAETVRRHKWLFAPTVDALHTLALAGTTYWLTGDVTTALVAASVYATYATQVVQFSALTPRVLGALLVSAIVSVVFYGSLTGRTLPLVVAVVLGVVLLHTHKMSSQTVLFLFLFLTAFYWDLTYFAAVVAMVVLAVVVSGGHYLTILRGHLNIINFWRRQHRAGRPAGEFFRRYGKGAKGGGDAETIAGQIFAWVKRNEVFMYAADSAWTLLLAAVLGYSLFIAPDYYTNLPPLARRFAVWAMFLLGFAVLTQYAPYFKMVGDGYKYFIWAAFPTAVVLATVLPIKTNGLVAVGYVVVVCCLSLYAFVRMYLRVSALEPSSREVATDGKAALEFIERSDGSNVLPLPFSMSFNILYETDLNVLFHQNPKIEAESAFPVPIEPLKEIANRFDIDYVLVDTATVDLDEFDIEPFDRVFEKAGYVVLATARDPVIGSRPEGAHSNGT